MITTPRIVFGNTDIVVFDRNVPPEHLPVPEGYDRAEDNAYVFVRHIDECAFRTFAEVVSSCCGKVKVWKCSRHDRHTTRHQCAECPDRKDGVIDHA